MGLLQDVIDHARTYDQGDGKGSIFQRVEKDLISQAKENGIGTFSYYFTRSYDFEARIYELGRATVSGSGPVTITDKGNYMNVRASINYKFYDVFTDVLSLGHDLRRRRRRKNNFTKEGFMNIIKENDGIGEYDLPLSTPYRIVDRWRTKIEAVIKK